MPLLPARRWLVVATCVSMVMTVLLLSIPAQVGIDSAPPTSAKDAHARVDAKYARVMSVARHQIGDPYKYGADGPNAFDCSGLVLFVYRKAVGIHVQHLATAEYRKSTPITRSQARRGDLVFFHKGKNIYHAAIYAGHGRVLHAPHPGSHVQIDPIWTKSVWFGRLITKRS